VFPFRRFCSTVKNGFAGPPFDCFAIRSNATKRGIVSRGATDETNAGFRRGVGAPRLVILRESAGPIGLFPEGVGKTGPAVEPQDDEKRANSSTGQA
jgi:hypothetical protein